MSDKDQPVVGKINFNINTPPYQLKPHCCPICEGNGLVDNGFYNQTSGKWSSTSISFEQCRTCHGIGIIWG